MRVKKIISIALLSCLFVNTVAPSFASTLSEDGRYETFEGNSVTVSDVLEEDEADVEIEGNTLVNVASYESINDFYSIHGNLTNDGYIELDGGDGQKYKNFFLSKEVVNVKPSTAYTFVLDIQENTLVREDGTVEECFFMGGSSATQQVSYWKTRITMNGGVTGYHTFLLETKDDFSDIVTGDRGFINIDCSGKLKIRYMIIEGDYTNYNIDYFRGIKSVGQNENGVIIESKNKNILDKAKLMIGIGIDGAPSPDAGIQCIYKSRASTDYIDVIPNSNVYFKSFDEKVLTRLLIFYDEDKKYLGEDSVANFSTEWVSSVPNKAKYMRVVFLKNDGTDNVGEFYNSEIINSLEIMLSYSPIAKYVEHNSSTRSIVLTQPLRGLSNEVKDRIVKKDGKWYVERNCAEIQIKNVGWSGWNIGDEANGWSEFEDSIIIYSIDDYYPIKPNTQLLCDKLPYITGLANTNSVGVCNQSWFNKGHLAIRLSEKELSELNMNGVSNWVSENPLTVVYQLATPIYEELSIESTVNIYADTTYISNNSNIPANMKVTVDRVLNRAKDAVELAKTDSTTENISRARMWTNLIKESLIKDQLQDEVNSITEIKDMELERKTVTSNMDLYVKSDNMLSMTLSTNSVSFDNYSGVNDIEKLKALEIAINSSLPYSLNSYLVTEIQNNDGSSKINREHFNIRESSQGDYKKFLNIGEKLILKDGCEAGNNVMHNIDMKLNGNDAHKADVYKTVIKFEAEQK